MYGVYRLIAQYPEWSVMPEYSSRRDTIHTLSKYPRRRKSIHVVFKYLSRVQIQKEVNSELKRENQFLLKERGLNSEGSDRRLEEFLSKEI
jgi:hypothetical protein